MIDNREVLKSNQNPGNEAQKPEQDKLGLYTDILYRGAIALLAEYLPDAVPKEPTEILHDMKDIYLGKFTGKHYIQIEGMAILEFGAKATEIIKKINNDFRQIKTEGEERSRLELIKTEEDFDEIEGIITLHRKSQPEIEPEPRDWKEPEKLLKGRSQYSFSTWQRLGALAHELIHQRQAELDPEAFPPISSPDLDDIDPDSIQKDKLKELLQDARQVYDKTIDDNSLFYVVIEGAAVVGSFYVMSKLSKDLAKSGQLETASKVIQARNRSIGSELIRVKREERAGKVRPYDLNYVEGFRIMRKLYKQLGIKNIPRILAAVDLVACQKITKGSPQYQQIMENPTLLPGLQKAT